MNANSITGYDTSSRTLDNGDAGAIALDVDGSLITHSYMQTNNTPTTLQNNAIMLIYYTI